MTTGKATKQFYLTLIFTLVLFIISFLWKDKPSVEYEIVSEVDVLDIHKPLEDLTILYDGTNISKSKENLRFITVDIKNNGDIDILQERYDKNIPWGIAVENGKFLQVKVTDTNSYDYIYHTMNPKIVSDSRIEFSQIAFDINKYFQIEMLIIHDKTVFPVLKPFGKIGGIDKIQIRPASKKNKISFWKRVLAGNILIHIVRFYLYIIFICILSILFVVPIGQALWKSKNRQKKKQQEEI